MPGRSSSQSLLKSISAAASGSSLRSSSRNVCRLPAALKHNLQPSISSSRRFIATSLPQPSPAVQLLQEAHYQTLKNALYENGSPEYVWSSYNNLLNTAGFRDLPLAVHQEVLRRCTPPAQEVRVAHARRVIAGNVPKVDHIHEHKFQSIVRNIRLSGHVPALDDYHFILSQFAAVGNYPGSVHVYKELKGLGHVPTAETFGMVLQALAHRFTLPIHEHARPGMVAEARSIFDGLMKEMRAIEGAVVPANIDLMFRVLKETMDYPAFETFMRWAYGIDMANPDRIPLELLERKSVPSVSGAESLAKHNLPIPFNTHALNTALDFLGRKGMISKMIQTFEVLTQPLPNPQEHFFSSFEDDDDDVGAILSPSQPAYTPPHAKPNTTTYNLLIRHAAHAGNHTVARHYLVDAMALNTRVVADFRQAAGGVQDADLPSPTFSLNKLMVLSVLGLSNTDKGIETMRWLSRKLNKIIRKKEADLDYHVRRRRYFANQAAKAALKAEKEARGQPRPTKPTSRAEPALEEPVASTSTSPAKEVAERPRADPSDAIFNLDFDSTAYPVDVPKPFDSLRHIELLERDIAEFKALQERTLYLIDRTVQRVKERLGRRVWEGKSVYLATDKSMRKVTRTKWEKIVNFKQTPQSEIEQAARAKSRNAKNKGAEVEDGAQVESRAGTREGAPEFFSTSLEKQAGNSKERAPKEEGQRLHQS